MRVRPAGGGDSPKFPRENKKGHIALELNTIDVSEGSLFLKG